jgi:hypothetical protein
MKNFLTTMLSLKKSNKELTDKILKEKEAIITHQKLITQLEQELDYERNLNLRIQGDLLMTSTRKETSATSEYQAQLYCIEIKKKFKFIVDQIEVFEKTLLNLDLEKENVIEKNDDKFEKLSDEKMQILDDQEGFNLKIGFQKESVCDLEKRMSICLTEKLTQKNFYDSKDKEDTRVYDVLQAKYYDLMNKMKEYMNEESAEEYEEMLSRRAIGELDKEKDDVNM